MGKMGISKEENKRKTPYQGGLEVEHHGLTVVTELSTITFAQEDNEPS
jgi:hypothetical protein